jgi:predicted nucleic acid-binding protein
LKPVVVDASAAGSWVLPDEHVQAAAALYAQACLQERAFVAPLLWHWEVGNLLVLAVRRKRIDEHTRQQCVEELNAAQVQMDAVPDMHRLAQITRLAQTHQLTFYDATYLELVLRLNGELASYDQSLINAAQACGITCLDF